MKKGKAMRRQDLPVSENVYGGMTEAELSQALEKELQLAQQDIKIEQTKDRKNMLESYVYETRIKLLNTYRSFATKLEKEGISRNLQQTEDWLYDDGVDESENIYSEKLDDLKKVVNECNKAEQWLQEKTQRHDSLPKNADPIPWSSEIKRKADALDAMCKHIMRSKASGTRPEDTMDAEQRNKQDDMRVD